MVRGVDRSFEDILQGPVYGLEAPRTRVSAAAGGLAVESWRVFMALLTGTGVKIGKWVTPTAAKPPAKNIAAEDVAFIESQLYTRS